MLNFKSIEKTQFVHCFEQMQIQNQYNQFFKFHRIVKKYTNRKTKNQCYTLMINIEIDNRHHAIFKFEKFLSSFH